MSAVTVIAIVLGGQAVIWLLIYVFGFKRQREQLAKSLRKSELTGEHIVISPQNGYYAKTRGRASIKSMGVMALTDRRLIFRLPLWGGFEIPIENIAGVSEALWFQGMYRNGRQFLVVRQRDGTEIGFQTKNAQAWADALKSLVISNT